MRLARLPLAALVLALAAVGPRAGPARAAGTSQPVVVELFTAEGCGACPPADALLDRLAREQPVAGAEIVALELHVDYFDRPGAVDPFAQAAFGARQAEYMRAFGKRGAYTPQMVVDGRRELVGSREREAQDAVTDAARAPKAKVSLARSGDRLTITIDALPDDGPADVVLVLTEDSLTTQGTGTARAGAHGPIVRELRKIGTAGGSRGPVQIKDVDVKIDGSWRRENVRAVVFVQGSKSLEIAGAGAVSMQ
jgi:hypothetical protein